MGRQLNVLLVNPYIYDVSAYNFWSAPLGLLYVGAVLRMNGMSVRLLDCLQEDGGKRKEDGRSPFRKERVERPGPVGGTGRRFKRYGMSAEEVAGGLAATATPDLVVVTSIMTYWYEGTEEVVQMVRDCYPSATVVVGGIYPTLCYEHAKKRLGAADLIVAGAEGGPLYSFIEEVFGLSLEFTPRLDDLSALPYPALDLYEERRFVPLVTSFGCVYRCAYCATPYLRPDIIRRDAGGVVKEIRHWRNRGITRFALYDDNFLYRASEFAKPFLRQVCREAPEIAFYNPNALNAALIDGEAAQLLKGAGFREVRLGLEMVDPKVQRETGGKVTTATFEKAVELLSGAGFSPGVIQAYVLAGLPLQKCEDVGRSIDYARSLGIRVHLAQHTPIPHTPLFEKYQSLARYPIEREPLFQNNALFPFAWKGFTEEDMNELKHRARDSKEPRG